MTLRNFNGIILLLFAFGAVSCRSDHEDLKESERLCVLARENPQRGLSPLLNFIEDKQRFSVARSNGIYCLKGLDFDLGASVIPEKLEKWLHDDLLRVAALSLISDRPAMGRRHRAVIEGITQSALIEKNRTVLAHAWVALFAISDKGFHERTLASEDFNKAAKFYSPNDGLETLVSRVRSFESK